MPEKLAFFQFGGWISELSKINDFHGENKHKINIFIILLFFVLYH